MARAAGAEEKGFEKSVSCSDASDEPHKKKVRLDVKLKSQNDVDSGVTATQPSGTLSADSGNDAADKEFRNSSLHKKIDDPVNSSLETSEAEILHNLKMPRNTNIAVRGLSGVTNFQASNKPQKFVTNCNNEKDRKSVYEIIVEHNVAEQLGKPQPKRKMMMNGIGGNENKATHMVHFPRANLADTPRNSGTSEVAAKITEGLVRQAYEDWVHCGIPDDSGNM
jgi:hypothetical protein